MSKANETQIGGDHYKKKSIEPWDYIIANDLPFMEGSIVKYITRWRDKAGIKDLQKARHFIDKLIEVETAKLPKVEINVILPEPPKEEPIPKGVSYSRDYDHFYITGGHPVTNDFYKKWYDRRNEFPQI